MTKEEERRAQRIVTVILSVISLFSLLFIHPFFCLIFLAGILFGILFMKTSPYYDEESFVYESKENADKFLKKLLKMEEDDE